MKIEVVTEIDKVTFVANVNAAIDRLQRTESAMDIQIHCTTEYRQPSSVIASGGAGGWSDGGYVIYTAFISYK